MEGEVTEGERDEGSGEYEGVPPSGGFYCIYNFRTVASVDEVTIGFPLAPESVTDVIGPCRSQGSGTKFRWISLRYVNIPASFSPPPSEKREVEMSGGGLNIVGFCRALEAAWDKESTVFYYKNCTDIKINGGTPSITKG